MHIADDTLYRPFLLFLCRSVHTRTHGSGLVTIDTPSRLELGGRSGSGVPSNKSSIDGDDTTLPTVSLGTGPQPAQIQIQITGVHIAYRISRIRIRIRRCVKIYHCALGLPRERVCTVSPVSRRQTGSAGLPYRLRDGVYKG